MSRHMINSLFIFAAFMITCVAIATGSYFNAGLIVEINVPSEIRVRAPRDIEDFAGTERNRQAALVLAEGLDEVFTIDHSEWITASNNLSLRRTELEGIREAHKTELEEFAEAFAEWEAQMLIHEDVTERIYSQWQTESNAARAEGLPIPPSPTIPLEPERPMFEGAAFFIFADLPLRFSEAQQHFIIEMEDENFTQMWTAVESAANTVQNTEIIHYTDLMTERAVREALRQFSLDRTKDELAEYIVLFSLRPNAVPNVELNEQRYRDAAGNYVIALIYEGEILVDEGEIVTQEIYDILARLDMLAPESLFDHFYSLLGVYFLVAVLFLVCLMFLTFYKKSITCNFKEAMLLFTLYTLTIVLVWTLRDFSFPFLPILIFPMLVSILIERRCATALSVALMLICFFIVDGNLTFLLFYLAAGMLFCMFSRYTTDRNKSIWIGLLISAIMFALSVSVNFIFERNEIDINLLLITSGFAAASGILTVFLCMGSLPLWETFFGVVTPIKLLDLTNPTNLLLRRLTIEAPGTYHHSLIVANLAETAAY
ncbi:MAG: hypothetical protein LBI27_05495, partial [Clostridiales bacterium]|nr:hypothetical protein [Clostridiales bacterium]